MGKINPFTWAQDPSSLRHLGGATASDVPGGSAANTLASAKEAAMGWPAGVFDRLQQVRARYDPSGVFA